MSLSSNLGDVSGNNIPYEMLFEAHPQVTWAFEDHSLKVVACNQVARDYYGYTRESFLELSVADLIVANQLLQFIETARSSPNTDRSPILFSHVAQGGRIFLGSVQFGTAQLGSSRFYIVLVLEPTWSTLNITQLKMLVEHLPILVNAFDENNRVILWNKECERVTGYTFEEVHAMDDPFAVLYPDPEQRRQMFEEFQKHEGKVQDWELTLTAKDGSLKTISWTNLSPRIPITKQHLWAMGVDITANRQVRQELREKELILAGITKQIPGVAIFQYILEGNQGYYSYITENVQEISGVSAADLLSGQRKLRDLLSEKDQKRLAELIVESSQREGQVDFESEAIDVTGRKRVWLFRSLVHRQSPERVIFNKIILDITEQRQIQSQIERAQKYQMIGILAGGIAHDFNNLLTSIIGNAQLGQMQIEPDSELNEYLADIIQSSEKAAGLCQKILTYAGRKMGRKTWIDLNQAIIELKATLGSIVSNQITVELDLQPDLPPIMVDPTLIDQLLVNLITNSSESYQGREGVIHIKTQLVEQRAEDFRKMLVQESCSAGKYLLIELSDQGCGIEEDKIPLIFEPYYTTKEMGRGLGLAAVQGIVRSMNGAINVHSQPNRGTTFQIYLPSPHKSPPLGGSLAPPPQ
jgi:PAS domain S-box-containing protein